MGKIAKYLNQLIIGKVFDFPEILEAYSTDRSIIKIVPEAVAIPESTDDVVKIMRFLSQIAMKGMPTRAAVRGSGLDETGADLTEGLVISTEKLNKIEEIDVRERLVRVQAGITLRELNSALKMHGLTIPVNANENETIGSLIANNFNDSYASRYGGIAKMVECAEIVLTNGDCIQTGRIGERQINKKIEGNTFESEIYKTLLQFAKDFPDLIAKIRDKNTNTGYSNVSKSIRKNSVDLLPLVIGSEGTLCVITEVILRAELIQKVPSRCMVLMKDFPTTATFLQEVSKMNPREAHFIDTRILKISKNYQEIFQYIRGISDNRYLVICSFGDKPNKAAAKIKKLKKTFADNATFTEESIENRRLFSEVNKMFVNNAVISMEKECPPLVTNFHINQDKISDFVNEIYVVEEKLHYDFPMLGSFMTGNYSICAEFNFDDPADRKKAITFLKAGALLIHRQNGSICGATPEGYVKSIVLDDEISLEEYNLYDKVKVAFDPYGILSPSIKVSVDSNYVLSHLRTTKSPKIVL